MHIPFCHCPVEHYFPEVQVQQPPEVQVQQPPEVQVQQPPEVQVQQPPSHQWQQLEEQPTHLEMKQSDSQPHQKQQKKHHKWQKQERQLNGLLLRIRQGGQMLAGRCGKSAEKLIGFALSRSEEQCNNSQYHT